jgi:hypothetical protein
MRWRLYALGLLLVAAVGVRADEIRLKDGSKIVGTIVDFQNDSFKVQTAYGFAMVRKDSIVQIIPTGPGQGSEPTKDAAAAAPAMPVKPEAATSSPVVKSETQPAVSRSATASSPTPLPAVARPAPAASVEPLPAATAYPMPKPNPRLEAPAPLSTLAPAPAPAIPPPPAVAPAPIRESVRRNTYTNETYDFQLYRPPGWDVMPEARKALPNAITAMGTSDDTTLFLVGREPAHDSLEVQAGNSERALEKIYENYRQIASTRRIISGLPAVEWQFRGVADGHDWSVTALAIARGSDVFTLLGMTYADSDLIQIRENVIAKMIGSLQFGPPH